MLGEYLPTLPADSTWLFISNKQETLPDGSKHPAPLTERGLSYLVAKYAQLSKSEDLSQHDLRHRFGYCMAQTLLLGLLPPARVCVPPGCVIEHSTPQSPAGTGWGTAGAVPKTVYRTINKNTLVSVLLLLTAVNDVTAINRSGDTPD